MRVFKSGITTGTVKFFSLHKGFGFIQSDELGDIFLHASMAGEYLDQLKPQASVRVSYVTAQKGLAVSAVHSVKPPACCAGTVKFFKFSIGYGFIESEEHGDVFLHARVARAAGIEPWQGLAVLFKCKQTSRGMQATTIRPMEGSHTHETEAPYGGNVQFKKELESTRDAKKLNGSAERMQAR